MKEKKTRSRRRHSAEFKVRVALEAIRERQTVNEIASESGVHPTQVSAWKKQVLETLPGVLGRGEQLEAARRTELEAGLYEEIGRLKVELDWLKKSMELWFKATPGAARMGGAGAADLPAVRASWG